MKLIQLKNYIESVANIIEWNPTETQLNEIAKQLTAYPISSIGDVQGIVSEICPNARMMILEGVDNSDINTLIALAIAATKEAK